MSIVQLKMPGAAAGGAERHLSGEGLRYAAAVAADQLLVRIHRHRVPLRKVPQVLQLHAGRQLRPARSFALCKISLIPELEHRLFLRSTYSLFTPTSLSSREWQCHALECGSGNLPETTRGTCLQADL